MNHQYINTYQAHGNHTLHNLLTQVYTGHWTVIKIKALAVTVWYGMV